MEAAIADEIKLTEYLMHDAAWHKANVPESGWPPGMEASMFMNVPTYEPEPEGCGADDRSKLGEMDQMGKEPVRVRETWVLEEANEPRLAPLVMKVCSPY